MGQYHIIANLDKKEFIHPHQLGDGLKLREFSSGGYSIQGLTLLLASSNGLGGGDFYISEEFNHIPGRWAGDRIVIAGDYDDNESSPGYNVYSKTNSGEFQDISYQVLLAILSSQYDLEEVEKGEGWYYENLRKLYSEAKNKWDKVKAAKTRAQNKAENSEAQPA